MKNIIDKNSIIALYKVKNIIDKENLKNIIKLNRPPRGGVVNRGKSNE